MAYDKPLPSPDEHTQPFFDGLREHKLLRSPRGTVFTSFSFNDAPVNVLTGGGYDPVTDTAELKVCPVRVERP